MITLLPKFYDKKDVVLKNKEVLAAKKELLKSNKLTPSEIEEINDFDITMCADAYSRNYEIRRINELLVFIKCR